MTTPFTAMKQHIRTNEANQKVTPANITKRYDRNGWHWQISFSKQVLYPNATEQNKRHYFSAANPLDCLDHANFLNQIMEDHIRTKNLNFEMKAEVSIAFRTFLGIPLKIPFTQQGWRCNPKKLRDDQLSLYATQSAEVTFTIRPSVNSNEMPDGDTLWTLLNTAASTHRQNIETKPSEPVTALTGITSRPSRNPLVWLGRLLSALIPRAIANLAPNSVKAMARPYPYGYKEANQYIDQPIFDSPIAATLANSVISPTVFSPAIALGNLGILAVACGSCDADGPDDIIIIPFGSFNDKEKAAAEQKRIATTSNGRIILGLTINPPANEETKVNNNTESETPLTPMEPKNNRKIQYSLGSDGYKTKEPSITCGIQHLPFATRSILRSKQ